MRQSDWEEWAQHETYRANELERQLAELSLAHEHEKILAETNYESATHWRKMYIQEAEQCNRFESEYKRIYQELQELKND